MAYFIVSEHPDKTLDGALHEVAEGPFPCVREREPAIEVATLPARDLAWQVYMKLVQRQEPNPERNNGWFMTLLSPVGLEEFRALRAGQAFVRQDLQRYDRGLIDLERARLRYQHRGMNGVALVGARGDFASAWVFFLNAAAKFDAELGTDSPELLDGGTFNPVSLATLDRSLRESCSRASLHFEPEAFVAAIQLDHSILHSSGCFFVETREDYLLLDLHCP